MIEGRNTAIPAPLPDNKIERLAALHHFKILDTEPEQSFDDLTFLASYICEAPISLVSLVDEDRQWFKSCVGLDVTETSREVSFCAYAILEPELLIIPDALKDKRFATNALVLSDPKIRFYAGMPFYTAGGLPLGTLCVIDTEPRQLNEKQEQALRVLARQLGSQMEHRRNLMELEEALNTLKLLGGILPICASCKKIRNEEEQWDSLEKYIMEHSEATFTHGVCPDCVQRLYPEYRENKT